MKLKDNSRTMDLAINKNLQSVNLLQSNNLFLIDLLFKLKLVTGRRIV